MLGQHASVSSYSTSRCAVVSVYGVVWSLEVGRRQRADALHHINPTTIHIGDGLFHYFT